MRITWNGTGSAWSPGFGNSSAVLEASGHRLLIDCGHTVPARLAALGVSLEGIDAVFITHLHGDHVYGLEELGFRSLLQWNRRPALLLAAELVGPLWEHVLAGTMSPLLGRRLELGDYFEVIPMQVDAPATVGPWRLSIRPVRHVPPAPAFGVKVTSGSLSVSFTGDAQAGVDPWFYEGTAAVFHDCSFLPPLAVTAHAHFEQLVAYPADWRERTSLVHYEDSVREWREDPSWRERLAGSRMRLADPFVPLTF